MDPTPFGDFAMPLTPMVDPVDATARPVTPIPPVEKDLPNTPWLSPDAPFACPAAPAGSPVVEVATPLIPTDPSPVARPLNTTSCTADDSTVVTSVPVSLS